MARLFVLIALCTHCALAWSDRYGLDDDDWIRSRSHDTDWVISVLLMLFIAFLLKVGHDDKKDLNRTIYRLEERIRELERRLHEVRDLERAAVQIRMFDARVNQWVAGELTDDELWEGLEAFRKEFDKDQ